MTKDKQLKNVNLKEKCKGDIVKHNFDTSKQNVFFTSDTHFWHKNIIKYCNRPYESVEEMNEAIIENWNSVVAKDDIVFHLGDFGFASPTKIKEIAARLNGHIWLIVGNHDWKMLTSSIIEECFEYVSQQAYIHVDGQSILLNHFPMLCYSGVYREKPVWQLFGHVHTSPTSEGADTSRMSVKYDTQYDVGVDNNNFRPISFSEVKAVLTNDIFNKNK